MYRITNPVASHRLWFVYFYRCNSYPSRGRKRENLCLRSQCISDATHTPHGDGNEPAGPEESHSLPGMQLIPLTGTETCLILVISFTSYDATHTPHGDGNIKVPPCTNNDRDRMQLIPLTGTETIIYSHEYCPVAERCNSYPSRGRKPNLNTEDIQQVRDATHTPHGDGNVHMK